MGCWLCVVVVDVGCCGLLLVVVGCYGLLWVIVGCCGLYSTEKKTLTQVVKKNKSHFPRFSGKNLTLI